MPEYKSADSLLSVTLHKNQFSEAENSFIGRVTRNTVTLKNLIAEIATKNEGISPYMIEHVANLLSDEMLKACKNGKAVAVLELGTMYITLSGAVTGDNPSESSIPGFKLNFTPSAHAQKTLSSIKIDKIVIPGSDPIIDKIINTFDQNTERNLNKGKGVRITGNKLKILGEDAGIWFAPLNEDGNAVKDETLWIPIDNATLGCNKPKSVEFYVPDGLTDSSYRIVLRTRYSSGDEKLKSPITGYSKIVNIVA